MIFSGKQVKASPNDSRSSSGSGHGQKLVVQGLPPPLVQLPPTTAAVSLRLGQPLRVPVLLVLMVLVVLLFAPATTRVTP